MQELIIMDEEFENYSEELRNLETQLESSLTAIIMQLTKASQEAIPSGNLHDNLVLFIEALNGMSGQMIYITNKVKKEADAFIQEIDEIDGTLY